MVRRNYLMIKVSNPIQLDFNTTTLYILPYETNVQIDEIKE